MDRLKDKFLRDHPPKIRFADKIGIGSVGDRRPYDDLTPYLLSCTKSLAGKNLSKAEA